MSTLRSTLAILASATATVPVPYNFGKQATKPKQEPPAAADYARIQAASAKRARRAARRLGGGS